MVVIGNPCFSTDMAMVKRFNFDGGGPVIEQKFRPPPLPHTHTYTHTDFFLRTSMKVLLFNNKVESSTN